MLLLKRNYFLYQEIKKVEGLTLSKIIQLNTEFKDCPEHVFFSSNNCKGIRNHQCIPKNAESESVIEDSESVVRENNKKDNTILGLVVATVILAVLFLIALGMVLHMTYIKNKKTVEGKKTHFVSIKCGFLKKSVFLLSFLLTHFRQVFPLYTS